MKITTLPKLCAAALLIACALPAAAMQQVFLVQNSGWMEPFYADPASQFKPLVGAVIGSVADPADEVTIAAFNQGTPAGASPAQLYSGKGPGDPARALASLEVARKASGAFADTDFKEAMVWAIRDAFKAQPGIVWIFTNNRNSPNNDQQTAERNREFYRLVHIEPSITRTLAFPLRMPVSGKHFKASGVMVYALAYGEPAAAHLNRLVESGRIGRVFTSAPARLKPLDQESVRVVPREVHNSTNVKPSLAKDGRTLVFDIDVSSLVPEIRLKADIENLFFPYEIASADLAAQLQAGGASLPITITPARLSNLLPGKPAEAELRLPLPLAQVPSRWSLAALRSAGKSFQLPAVIDIRLDQQRLLLSEDFKGNLARLFPGDPLSEVFLPPEAIRASNARIPVLLRIHYPLGPVLVAALGGLLLLAALIALWAIAGRKRRYSVSIDGVQRSIVIPARSEIEVRTPEGEFAGRIKRGFGAPQVIETAEGHSVSLLRK